MPDSPAPEEAIRECPWCGGEAYVASAADDSMFYVACTNVECFCAMGEGYDRDAMPEHSFRSRSAAIAAWNRRAGGERDAWQTIESAPKGEEPILLAAEGGIVTGAWSDTMGWFFGAKVGPAAIVIQCEPTHWQPLPAPPRTALAGQTEGTK